MSGVQPIAPLVAVAGITPHGRCRVALALADLHDEFAGVIRVTMASIASRAALSSVQARKHVHALIADGILRVVGNACGGAPGVAPQYAFNRRTLEQMFAKNPDFFGSAADQPTIPNGEAYQFSAGGADFLAFLVGEPGSRRVEFWRVDGGPRISYGDVPLRVLLRDQRVRTAWHAHLAIHGNEEAPIETMVELPLHEIAALAAWAQASALGRTESKVAHEL